MKRVCVELKVTEYSSNSPPQEFITTFTGAVADGITAEELWNDTRVTLAVDLDGLLKPTGECDED